MPHRRTLCLLTNILALTTAVALLGSAFSFAAPRVADPRLAATVQIARAFYAAVNRAIATEDSRALDGIVAEDLVTHGSLASVAPGREGLVHYLSTLHATNPQLELAVEQVVVTRHQALVHLAVRGDGEGRFLGSPLRDGSPPWGTVDALAIAGHQVVEYWSGATVLTLLEPLGQASLAMAAATTRVVALDRLTIAPGASFAAAGAQEARLLYVETGTVIVDARARGPQTSPYRGAVPAPPPDLPVPTAVVVPHTQLAAGMLLPLPTWSRTDVHNEGKETASVLVLAASTPAVPDGATSDPHPSQAESDPYPSRSYAQPRTDAGIGLMRWPAGVPQISASGASVAPLTGNVPTALPGERMVVAVGRVTLAAGVTLPAFEAAGPHLVVVNAGTVDLAASGEPAWIYHGAGSDQQAATLGTATGALLHAGTAAAFHNSSQEPLVLTIIAILPDNSDTEAML